MYYLFFVKQKVELQAKHTVRPLFLFLQYRHIICNQKHKKSGLPHFFHSDH